jgi:Lysozyme like domain
MITFLAIVALVFALFEVYVNTSGSGSIPDVARKAGFTEPDLSIAVAIALAESSGNPEAVGDNGDSIGLWQIDTRFHPEYANVDLTDPQTNANAAFAIYQQAGNSFTPWTTFNTGAYQQYMNS